MDEDGSCSVSIALCGIGRWSFKENARWFFSDPFNEFEYETPRQNKLRDTLRKLKFRAEFDIEEEEIDISYSHACYEVSWDNGKEDFKEKKTLRMRVYYHITMNSQLVNTTNHPYKKGYKKKCLTQ